MKYDICTQYFNKGDTAWWVNYFGKIEPVEVYEVQRMGPTPDYAVYYWIKPKKIGSKIRTWVFTSVYHLVRILNKIFRTVFFDRLLDNRFMIKNFFWWPGHAVMVGDTIFFSKEELIEELEISED